MKKNITMRIAAVLFILTMITTCVFATTFAKYTTSGEATDSARVAKWGVTIEASGDELFASEYGATVKSTVDVVAPGTSGSLAEFDILGTPEVSTHVSFVSTVDIEGWTLNSALYFPVVVKVGNRAVDLSGCDEEEEVETAIKDAIDAITYDYNPGVAIPDTNLLISWEWAFIGDDTNDTALGDLAAENDAPTISLLVVCTVEQVN